MSQAHETPSEPLHNMFMPQSWVGNSQVTVTRLFTKWATSILTWCRVMNVSQPKVAPWRLILSSFKGLWLNWTHRWINWGFLKTTTLEDLIQEVLPLEHQIQETLEIMKGPASNVAVKTTLKCILQTIKTRLLPQNGTCRNQNQANQKKRQLMALSTSSAANAIKAKDFRLVAEMSTLPQSTRLQLRWKHPQVVRQKQVWQ